MLSFSCSDQTIVPGKVDQLATTTRYHTNIMGHLQFECFEHWIIVHCKDNDENALPQYHAWTSL